MEKGGLLALGLGLSLGPAETGIKLFASKNLNQVGARLFSLHHGTADHSSYTFAKACALRYSDRVQLIRPTERPEANFFISEEVRKRLTDEEFLRLLEDLARSDGSEAQ